MLKIINEKIRVLVAFLWAMCLLTLITFLFFDIPIFSIFDKAVDRNKPHTYISIYGYYQNKEYEFSYFAKDIIKNNNYFALESNQCQSELKLILNDQNRINEIKIVSNAFKISNNTYFKDIYLQCTQYVGERSNCNEDLANLIATTPMIKDNNKSLNEQIVVEKQLDELISSLADCSIKKRIGKPIKIEK